MKALVARELRVKARGEEPALLRGDDRSVAKTREDIDAGAIERGEMFREVALKTEDAGARGQRAAITNRGLQVVLAPGSTRAKVPAWPRRVRATPRQRAWHRGSASSPRRSPSRAARDRPT